MSESERFLIRRVPAPRWIGSGRHPDPERVYDALGEQAEWGFADPWMYRALASPLTYEPMLRAPKRGDDVTHGPVAYWSSLLHLIVYGFGWGRPIEGFAGGIRTAGLWPTIISGLFPRSGMPMSSLITSPHGSGPLPAFWMPASSRKPPVT